MRKKKVHLITHTDEGAGVNVARCGRRLRGTNFTGSEMKLLRLSPWVGCQLCMVRVVLAKLPERVRARIGGRR